MKYRKCLAVVGCAIGLAGVSVTAYSVEGDETFEEKKTKTIGGEKYTFIKRTDGYSEETIVLESSGKKINENGIPRVRQELVSQELQALLGKAENKDEFKVIIGLKEPILDAKTAITIGEAEATGVEERVIINGKDVSRDEIEVRGYRKRAKQVERAKAKAAASKNIAAKLGELNSWMKDKEIALQLENGLSAIVVTLKKNQINKLLATGKRQIVSIELFHEIKKSIGSAMLETRVDNWALDFPSRHGSGVGIWMTEPSCPNPGHIPTNYTRVAGAADNHSENVSDILRQVSPQSYIYCNGTGGTGLGEPNGTQLNGIGGNPSINVVNMSAGAVNQTGNYEWLDRSADNVVYDNDILWINAAGNNGNAAQLSAPAKGFNVFSVGNYQEWDHRIRLDSSGGNPNTGVEKPDASAPGTNVTAGGHTMTGTSMAAPHIAGIVADMMSARSYLKQSAALMRAVLYAGATKNIDGSAGAVGEGGVDFHDSFYSYKKWWWDGPNSLFDSEASWDDDWEKAVIEVQYFLHPGHPPVDIVFAWLNRGTYTFENRNDPHPIGQDFDIRVYDPSGNYVDGSASWDNSFEKVSFQPTKWGNYRIKIRRYANRDTAADFKAGLVLRWN